MGVALAKRRGKKPGRKPRPPLDLAQIRIFLGINGKAMPPATAEAAIALCIAGFPIIKVSEVLGYSRNAIYQAVSELPASVHDQYLDEWKRLTIHRLWEISHKGLDRLGDVIHRARPRDAAVIVGILIDKIGLLSGIAAMGYDHERRERTVFAVGPNGHQEIPVATEDLQKMARRLQGSFVALHDRLERVHAVAGGNGTNGTDDQG